MSYRRLSLLGSGLLALSACTSFDAVDEDVARVTLVPADTAVTAGGTVTLHGVMVNQYGDVYPSEHIEYQSLDPSLTVTGGGVASATAVGVYGVIARRGDLADTGSVSVVPAGTLAFGSLSDQSAVVIVRTDGSALLRLADAGQGGGGKPAWLPGNAGLVYQYAIPGGAGAERLFVTDLNGSSHTLIVDPTGEKDSQAPRVSRDGSWVYFRYGIGGGEIWRIHPDGSGLANVTAGSSVHPYDGDTDPDPSPDGRLVAFASSRFTPQTYLAIHDLADGTDRPLGLAGWSPRWSPDGKRLAYWSADAFSTNGAIYVAQADGSEARQVSAPGRVYINQGLDWSPDGEWLVAQAAGTTDLIEVSSGLTVPLPYSAGYQNASWRW